MFLGTQLSLLSFMYITLHPPDFHFLLLLHIETTEWACSVAEVMLNHDDAMRWSLVLMYSSSALRVAPLDPASQQRGERVVWAQGLVHTAPSHILAWPLSQ